MKGSYYNPPPTTVQRLLKFVRTLWFDKYHTTPAIETGSDSLYHQETFSWEPQNNIKPNHIPALAPSKDWTTWWEMTGGKTTTLDKEKVENEMNKYAVIKKCFATEIVMVEAEHHADAINRVCEGEGYQTELDLEWDSDMPPHFWVAKELTMSDDDFATLRQSAPGCYEEDDV